MEKVVDIQNILLQSYGVSHKHALTISKLLSAVSDGLKTGFIWDIGPPVTRNQINDLINILKEQKLISNFVIIVGIEEEICALNKEKFLKCHTVPVFVDVSKNLEHPTILPSTDLSVSSMLNDIHEQVKLADNSIALNVDAGNYCIPTVIGLLAGFPIVYWYKPCDDNSHCLTGIDLIVYKVYQGSEVICSFSCPKELANKLEVLGAVEGWKESIKSFKDCHFESIISKNEFTVNL